MAAAAFWPTTWAWERPCSCLAVSAGGIKRSKNSGFGNVQPTWIFWYIHVYSGMVKSASDICGVRFGDVNLNTSYIFLAKRQCTEPLRYKLSIVTS